MAMSWWVFCYEGISTPLREGRSHGICRLSEVAEVERSAAPGLRRDREYTHRSMTLVNRREAPSTNFRSHHKGPNPVSVMAV